MNNARTGLGAGYNLKLRVFALGVTVCLVAGTASANPTGATVTSGSAAISSAGSKLTVTNTPNTIINWHNFSINPGETTQFIQQNASSAVLNRITGGDPSLILGTLQSNGRVFLINPSGIVFGAGSVVNVAGLVASTLNITDANFLAGKHIYNANIANPGNVTNAGEIRTPTGGFVYLIGTKVENTGVITTPSGEAILAAGNSVEVVDSTDPSQRVVVRAQSQDVNLSQLMLQNDGNIFGVLNSGRVSANTVTQDATGRIYFTSAGNITTAAGSITEAKGTTALDGGHIQAFADLNGSYSGTFDASGHNGGFLETSAAYLDISGINLNLRALDASGHGGSWLLDPLDFIIGAAEAGLISAQLAGQVDVTIDTTNGSTVAGVDGGPGTTGNIAINANITGAGAGATSTPILTLNADNNISLAPGVTIGSAGSNTLTLVMNAGTSVPGGSINLGTGSKIDLNSTATLVADGSINGGQATIKASTVDLTAGQDITAMVDTADITAHASNADITALSPVSNVQISGPSRFAAFNAQSINLKLQSGIRNDSVVTLRALSSTVSSPVNLSLVRTSIHDIGGSLNLSTSGSLSLNGSTASIISQNGPLSISASSISLANNSLIQSQGTLNISDPGSLVLNSSTITSTGNLTINTGSLTETSSSINNPFGSGANITLNSNGNVILTDSDIVADKEVRIQTLGELYLNTLGLNLSSGESHISTYSNNTIFLYFPTLFSGGFLLDGIGGIFVSPYNPFTGFFTGTNLDTLAILNTNLFITYAPAGLITTIVSQNNTNTLATNSYIDAYGPNQTGPGDDSFTYGVLGGDPWVDGGRFGGVRECS